MPTPLLRAYRVLGVAAHTPMRLVKSAYYKKALQTHPDRAGTTTAQHEQFREYAEAVALILKHLQINGDDELRGRSTASAASTAGEKVQFDPAAMFEFVGKSLNKNLQAELKVVGQTMEASGLDRGGWFEMAAIMAASQTQPQHTLDAGTDASSTPPAAKQPTSQDNGTASDG
eukprot:m.57955 g.57955  ORF g.57955 m.57955 type:complete len:173 (+) comp11645_c0_seq1:109-627(+)